MSYIRMNILSPNFPTAILSAGEVAFRQQSEVVPEPTSLLLSLSVGYLVGAFVRRKRKPV